MTTPSAGRTKQLETGLLFTQGYALSAAANFVIGKYALGYVGAWRFAAITYIMAALINTVWDGLSSRGQMPSLEAAGADPHNFRRHWLWVAIHCLASALGVICVWLSVDLIPAHVAAILSRLEAVVGIALGMWWLHERFSPRQWLGIVITAAGVVLVRWGALSGSGLGFAFAIVSALALGFSQVAGKLALRAVSVPRLVLYRGWSLALIFSLGWLLLEPGWPRLGPAQWLWLAASALIGPILARNTYLLALSYLPVSQVMLLNQTQPLYTILIAMLTLHELPGALTVIGAVVIVAGLVVVLRGKPAASGQQPIVSPET